MNKFYSISMLAALLFVFCGLSAQNLHYDFEQCNVGDKVAETLGEPWTTWNQNPGSTEDAFITDEHCQGTRALKIDNGNDLVLKLGNKTNGAYHISFDMYIPENKEGYFNILHEFTGSNSVWAFQMWLKSQQYGNYIYPGGDYEPFDVPYDEWFTIDIDIYLDDALASVKINGDIISIWNYTEYMVSKYNSISALNFYPSCYNENGNGYYIDNVSFTELEGPFVLDLVPEQETINMVMLNGTQDTLKSNITNEGNVIGRILDPWIDYGIGQEEGETKVLHYDSDPCYYYGNYNDNPYIELGVYFYNEYLLDSVNMVGMRIEKMQYYLQEYSYWGLEGPLTFRVYNRINGTLLAEKILDRYAFGDWNTVEFDQPIPLRGHPVLATVGFQQVNGGYPISLDAGPSLPFEADLVRLNGDDWFSLNENSMLYGGDDYGNHNIRLICSGTPVDTHWVRNDYLFDANPYNNFLSPGQSKDFELAFSTSGLDYGEYEAVLRFETTNAETPELAIPIKLKVSGTNVDELAESKYNVYPNPTTGKICIKVEGLQYVNISNVLGQVIFDDKVNCDRFEYDLSKYGEGLYVIRIEAASGTAIKRVAVTQ